MSDKERCKSVSEVVSDMRSLGDKLVEGGRDAMTSECAGLILHRFATMVEDACRNLRPGHAADMRTAIEAAMRLGAVSSPASIAVCPPTIFKNGYSPDDMYCMRCRSVCRRMCEAVHALRASVARPPRNCDVYDNETDAMNAFMDARPSTCYGWNCADLLKWMYEQANKDERRA